MHKYVRNYLSTRWQKLIGSLVFICHFQQKSPIISGSFVENDLQHRGSYESAQLPVYQLFMHTYLCMYMYDVKYICM